MTYADKVDMIGLHIAYYKTLTVDSGACSPFLVCSRAGRGGEEERASASAIR
jgi:hypothetical protein